MIYKFTLHQNLTYIFSKFGNIFKTFFPVPERKAGISVMMRVKNEEEWIALSLRSLEHFADEVIIIDNGSTDGTYDEILKIKKNLTCPIIIKKNNDPDICKISNEALSLTSFRWIFRWDGDFIAYTSGKRNIIRLRKYLLSLNQKNFYQIYPLTINFAGDFFHVKKNYEIHSEGYIHTYHPSSKYIKRGLFEVLKVPWFFKIKRINEIYFIHIGTAKSFPRLTYRFFWLFWLRANKNGEFPAIEDYMKNEAQEKWNSAEIDKIARKKMYEIIISKLRKYDPQEFGDYPKLMKPLLENPPFKIIYKDGKPFSRTDLI